VNQLTCHVDPALSLGGTWDPASRTLHVKRALPARRVQGGQAGAYIRPLFSLV